MSSGITRDGNGTYHWVGVIDGDYDRKTVTIIYSVLGGMCALFIVLALTTDAEMLGATLLSCLAVMAVVSAIALPLIRAGRGRQQKYEMNEEYVRFVGYGKEDAYFYYKNIRKVRIFNSRNMMEVKGHIVSAPFFVPHEDFGFVRNYVLHRLPENAEVVYE